MPNVSGRGIRHEGSSTDYKTLSRTTTARNLGAGLNLSAERYVGFSPTSATMDTETAVTNGPESGSNALRVRSPLREVSPGLDH